MGQHARGASFRRLTFRKGELWERAVRAGRPDDRLRVRWFGRDENAALPDAGGQVPESEQFEFPGDILAISPSTSSSSARDADRREPCFPASRCPGGTPRDVLEHVSLRRRRLFAPTAGSLAVTRPSTGRRAWSFRSERSCSPTALQACVSHSDGRSIAFWEVADERGAVSVIDRAGDIGGTSRADGTSPAAPRAGAPTAARSGSRRGDPAKRMPSGRWTFGQAPSRHARAGRLELDDVSREGQVLVGPSHDHPHGADRVGGRSQPARAHGRRFVPADLRPTEDRSPERTGQGSGRAPCLPASADGSPAVKLGEGTGRSLSPMASGFSWQTRPQRAQPRATRCFRTGPGERRALDPGGLTDGHRGRLAAGRKERRVSALDSSGGSRLYVQAVDGGGTPRPIGPQRTRILPTGGAVSPDARFVLGIGGNKLLLVPIDGNSEARVVPGFAPPDRVAQWTSDSQALYVYQVVERGFTVWLLDLQTGRRCSWREIPIVYITTGAYLLGDAGWPVVDILWRARAARALPGRGASLRPTKREGAG